MCDGGANCAGIKDSLENEQQITLPEVIAHYVPPCLIIYKPLFFRYLLSGLDHV